MSRTVGPCSGGDSFAGAALERRTYATWELELWLFGDSCSEQLRHTTAR